MRTPLRANLRRQQALCLALPLLALLGGCQLQTPLSTLDPAGPAAAAIANVWWVMAWGSAIVTLLMVGLGLYATCRHPDRRRPVRPGMLLVVGGVLFPLAAIVPLLLYGVKAGDGFLAQADDPQAYHVHVRAHQWWWEVTYPGATAAAPDNRLPIAGLTPPDPAAVSQGHETGNVPPPPLTSINIMHVPAGRPIHVTVTAADVIHSFWVPRLGGKIDAIPGHTNTVRLQADAPGRYHGVCAEFCGTGHTDMALVLVAHDEAGLTQALQALRAPAATPTPRLANADTPGGPGAAPSPQAARPSANTVPDGLATPDTPAVSPSSTGAAP